jgi:uncharacterized lipoprotein NlpE involved in copper resistance
MIYNQKRMNGVPMPLLMGCTKPSTIETVRCETKVVYDPISQTVVVECLQIGTRSLKTSSTHYGNNHCKTDKKNEIDDKKQK